MSELYVSFFLFLLLSLQVRWLRCKPWRTRKPSFHVTWMPLYVQMTPFSSFGTKTSEICQYIGKSCIPISFLYYFYKLIFTPWHIIIPLSTPLIMTDADRFTTLYSASMLLFSWWVEPPILYFLKMSLWLNFHDTSLLRGHVCLSNYHTISVYPTCGLSKVQIKAIIDFGFVLKFSRLKFQFGKMRTHTWTNFKRSIR